MKTLKVSLAIGQRVSRDGFACQDEGQRAKPLGSLMATLAPDASAGEVNALREPHKGVILQSQSQEELDALLPSAEGATARRGIQERVTLKHKRRV